MLNCKILNKPKNAVYKKFVEKKNKSNSKRFFTSSFEDRVLFVPHCMRNIKACKAKEEGGYYICAECGCCKIDKISKKSKILNYKALYILKGGRVVEKIITETGPKAILAVACFYEGEAGMKLCEKHKIPVQFAALTKDGCVDTDVSLDELFKIMELKHSSGS